MVSIAVSVILACGPETEITAIAGDRGAAHAHFPPALVDAAALTPDDPKVRDEQIIRAGSSRPAGCVFANRAAA